MKKLLLLLNLILVPVSYFGYRYYKETPPREDYSSYAIRSDSGNSTILQVIPDEAAISSKEVDEVAFLPHHPRACRARLEILVEDDREMIYFLSKEQAAGLVPNFPRRSVVWKPRSE